MKKIFISIFSLILITTISCKKTDSNSTNTKISQHQILNKEQIKEIIKKIQNTPVVPVKNDEYGFIKTNYGVIKIQFFPDKAPNTCSNFKRLANAGFYDGTTFHRVIQDFVIQGGDILSRDNDRANDGTGEIGYTIDAEISSLSHERGYLAMARRQNDLNSASSQFYICLTKLPSLDGAYTVFAKVIEGMEVVDRIAKVKTDENNNPIERIEMIKVWVGKQ